MLGGTFNPVHNAHLMMAEMAKEQFALDKIVFMTSGNPPHKNASTIDPQHRFNMVKLAIEENADFVADDYEVKKETYSYTFETIEYMKQKYPQSELFFIIGSDSLRDMPKWMNGEKLLSMCSFLVFDRKGACEDIDALVENIKAKYGAKVYKGYAPYFDISSSMIRTRLLNGETVRYLIPDAVIEYISSNGLYCKEAGNE